MVFFLPVSFFAGVLTVVAPFILPFLPDIVSGSFARAASRRGFPLVELYLQEKLETRPI